jgi:hypothetical protein
LFTITATASDPDGSVESVTLWYRYSSDYSSWTAWVLWGTDISSPWEWSFDAPAADGYYEFYSIAEDDDGNVEAAPATADARCGIDTTTPSASYPTSPADADKLTDTTPVFDWTEVEDLSGVSYELMISDSSDFSSLVLYRTGLATSTYALSADEALSEGTYYWRVRATDGAGNLSSWSTTRSFTIEVVVPPPPVVPLRPSLMLVFCTLMTVFGVMGGFVFVYIHRFRPIPPAISLKRLKALRPLIRLKHLRAIKPAISLRSLTPAPITLAPGLPVGPVKPIPITRPPAPALRKVVPKAMTPTEILEHLNHAPPSPPPKISIERLKRVVKPVELGILLGRLKEVVRPLKPAIPLTSLTRVGRAVEPGIPMKRLKRVIRPMKPRISLERLNGVRKISLKPRGPPERKVWGKESKTFFERLKREVRRKRGDKNA